MGYDPANPFYPLPADYGDLSPADQKAARLSVLGRHRTPEEVVEAWTLFRALYLFPLPEGLFYRKKRRPSPQAHYTWLRDFAAYPRNAIAAPRGSAKSVVLGTELPLMLALTRPYIHVTLCLGSGRKVSERFDDLMAQLETNEYILEDFGEQQPRGRSRIWNHSDLSLENGSRIRGISVDARKLGARPHVIILDDPEYDEDKEGADTQLLKQLDRLVFHEMLPMLEPDEPFIWIGTMLSRHSALWHACFSDDKRFANWNRRVYSVDSKNTAGKTTYFWPELWDAGGIARLERELGRMTVNRDYRNNPLSADDRSLPLHPTYNFYTLEGAKVRWRLPNAASGDEIFERDYTQWLDGLRRVILVDPAISQKATADYSALLAIGIDIDKCWWILDIFLGHPNPNQLIDTVCASASKWQASLVGVEDIGFQRMLLGAVKEKVAEHVQVWPVRYPPRLSKSARIQALASRFSRYQIRILENGSDQFPMKELIHEIENFTMDMQLLRYRDAVDCLSMMQFCPMPTPTGYLPTEDAQSIEAMLLSGRHKHPDTGIPLLNYFDIRTIDPRLLDEVRRRHLQITKTQDRAESAASRPARVIELGSALTD